MSDDMFNNGFDPLDILLQQQQKTGQLDNNIKQLAIAFNSRNDLLDQLVENVKMLNTKVQELEAVTQWHEAELTRLRLGRELR